MSFKKNSKKIFNKDCYCDNKIKKIIKFQSEVEPFEIPVTSDIFKYKFPKFIKIDYKLLKISNIGKYSIAKPDMSYKICKYILKYLKNKNITVTDALGNVGGMTIMLAHFFDKVNVCEIVQLRYQILKNNLQVYNLLDIVNITCGDYYEYMFKFKQDVIFFDPPWGGIDYHSEHDLPLCINNINITCVIIKLLKYSKYIFLLVPYNFDFNYFLKNITKKNIKINIHSLCDKINENGKLLIVIKSLYFE